MSTLATCQSQEIIESQYLLHIHIVFETILSVESIEYSIHKLGQGLFMQEHDSVTSGSARQAWVENQEVMTLFDLLTV